MTNDDPDLEFLDRYKANKPPVIQFQPSLSPEALMLIGYIVIQWGALGETIKFEVSRKRKHPHVPEQLRKETIRSEAKYQIEYLRRFGQHIYRRSRKNAVAEYEKIIDTINRLKGYRDKLVHGIFSLHDNKDPNAITVHYKRKKYTFSIKRLEIIGREIGRVNGALMEFDMWANYDTHRTLHERLRTQERQR